MRFRVGGKFLRKCIHAICLLFVAAQPQAYALVQYIGVDDPQNAIDNGGLHSLALRADGSLIAWGSNGSGQINAPAGSNYVAIAAGVFHSLALNADGTLVGWGDNDDGQTDVPQGSNYVSIAAGFYHSVALKSDGTLEAWGSNTKNQSVVPSGSDFTSIAAGNYHAVALRADGMLSAWGSDQYGQSTVPLGSNYVAVAASGNHSLALTREGELVAWGTNNFGESDVPLGSNFVAVVAGWHYSMALRSDGTLVAWGRNDEGQVDVPPGSNFVAIADSLAMTSERTLVAWGYAGSGQLDIPLPNSGFGFGSGIVPFVGSVDGGTRVEISGANLGNGSDITNVTLCGVSAAILTQEVDSVTVLTGAGLLGTGDVEVWSMSRGATRRRNSFTYKVMLEQTIDFPAVGNRVMSESVELSATASSSLPVTFTVVSGPASISDGNNLTFSGMGSVAIEATQVGDTNWSPAVAVTNTFIVAGADVTNGPEVGGNTITIQLESGMIDSVLVGGIPATISSGVGTSSVVLVVPPGLPVGPHDITLVTSDAGTLILTKAYTINPAGEIVGRNRLATLELSALNVAEGFIINGTSSSAYSGCSVGSAGDVNDDGLDDLILGAYGPRGFAGESYVIFGTPHGFSASLELAGLNGSNGFIMRGIDGFDQSGRSVSDAGDVNGDGIDDIVIGAYEGAQGGGSSVGEAYVVYGTSDGFPASLELSALNGTNGFVLNGSSAGDYAGCSVSGAGDVNGDGVDDLVIGAYGVGLDGSSDEGMTYVVYGTSNGFAATFQLSSLNGTNGFFIHGMNATDYSGVSVDGAGDVNGDGFDDLIIGAYGADPNGQSLGGEGYVVYGAPDRISPLLELSSLNGTNGFILNGATAGDRAGTSVSGAGDVNGDGLDDLIVGAYDADGGGVTDSGKSYVVFGAVGGRPSSLELSLLNGTNGFVIHGIDDNDRSGSAVSSAGDINEDGLDDIIVAASSADPNGNSNAGESYVIYGTTNGFPASLELSSLNDHHGFVINGTDGISAVGGSGDINGDGADDLIIGAIYGDPNGRSNAGETYVVYGESVNQAIFPASGSLHGGYQVSITGNNLGNGADVTNVTLNGSSVLSIDSQSSTRIVVTAAAGPVGTGDVVVHSISHGVAIKEDAFTYEKLGQAISFPVIANRLTTDAMALSATASSSLDVTFSVISGPAILANGTNLTFGSAGMVAVEATQSGDGEWKAALPVTNLFFVADIDTLVGPASGGNALTIDLGEGSITNALIGGKNAQILVGSGTSSVTLKVPSGLLSGAQDIILQTADQGDVLIRDMYMLNPAGSIRGGDPKKAIATGWAYSLALKKDGTLVGWGLNDEGQTVVPSGSNYVEVAAGGGHSLARRSDGTVIGWGLNDYGQSVVPPGSNYVAVAAGDLHSLALLSDGTLIGWGSNEYGETDVPPGNDYIAIAAGAAHSLALKSDGTLVAWGWNVIGQTDVPVGSNYVSVSAGAFHSLALKSDGTLVAWGYNNDGQCDVPSGNDYVAVSGGAFHSLALKSNGSLIGWGSNSNGETNVPVGSDYVAIASYWGHSLALKLDSSLVSWGSNSDGQTNIPSPNVEFGTGYGVDPRRGPYTGGTEVVITGDNLGSGSDITNVTICGSAATIVSQSADAVTVITGSGTAGTGDVVVRSILYGTTSALDVFTYEKLDQDIHFSPIGGLTVTDAVGVSASSTSGLEVQFSVVSGPGQIVDGTNLSFTAAGQVLLEASQGGDINWHPGQPVTNSIDVVGVITNVSPNIGTGAGGEEIVISGMWLGNGSDISNVMLGGVEAMIIGQDVHNITVASGVTNTPVAITGDVQVVSGYGTAVLHDAYNYLSPFPSAPVALSPVNIGSDRFVARWLGVDDVANYAIDVSDSEHFTSFVGVYSNWNAGPSTSALVTGLVDGATYWYRVRATNPYGSSSGSNLIEVPVSDNAPFVRVEITNGIASSASSDSLELSDLFHGTNMTYSVVANTNPDLVAAMIQDSLLILEYAENVTGMASITVRVTDPNGFSIDTTIIVKVVSEPGLNIGAMTYDLERGSYVQEVTVTNTSALYTAKSVTLTITSLSAGAALDNATGTDQQGNPEVQWNGMLAPGASKAFTLAYSTLDTNTVPVATIDVSFSLIDVDGLIAERTFSLSGVSEVLDGSLSFLIEFEATPGKVYFIQYADTLDGIWKTAYPGLTAHVDRVQWIDLGPPSTEQAPGAVTNRFYQIIESDE